MLGSDWSMQGVLAGNFKCCLIRVLETKLNFCWPHGDGGQLARQGEQIQNFSTILMDISHCKEVKMLLSHVMKQFLNGTVIYCLIWAHPGNLSQVTWDGVNSAINHSIIQ